MIEQNSDQLPGRSCQCVGDFSIGSDGRCTHCGHPPKNRQLIWNEDVKDQPQINTRVNPPRYAEQAAHHFYDRVVYKAGPKQVPRRFDWRSVAIGIGIWLIAGVLYYSQLDVGMLRLGSISLSFLGLIMFLKGLMGYGINS